MSDRTQTGIFLHITDDDDYFVVVDDNDYDYGDGYQYTGTLYCSQLDKFMSLHYWYQQCYDPLSQWEFLCLTYHFNMISSLFV